MNIESYYKILAKKEKINVSYQDLENIIIIDNQLELFLLIKNIASNFAELLPIFKKHSIFYYYLSIAKPNITMTNIKDLAPNYIFYLWYKNKISSANSYFKKNFTVLNLPNYKKIIDFAKYNNLHYVIASNATTNELYFLENPNIYLLKKMVEKYCCNILNSESPFYNVQQKFLENYKNPIYLQLANITNIYKFCTIFGKYEIVDYFLEHNKNGATIELLLKNIELYDDIYSILKYCIKNELKILHIATIYEKCQVITSNILANKYITSIEKYIKFLEKHYITNIGFILIYECDELFYLLQNKPISCYNLLNAIFNNCNFDKINKLITNNYITDIQSGYHNFDEFCVQLVDFKIYKTNPEIFELLIDKKIIFYNKYTHLYEKYKTGKSKTLKAIIDKKFH